MDVRSILENQVELLVAASKENAGLDSRHLADLTTALLDTLTVLQELSVPSASCNSTPAPDAHNHDLAGPIREVIRAEIKEAAGGR